MLKLALIGAGQRGNIYADYAVSCGNVKITAVIEPNAESRALAEKKYKVESDFVFTNIDDFFAKGKICDAIIVSCMDQAHFYAAFHAMDLGYDVLLEKPISPDPVECLKIQEKASILGRKVIVCTVLRHTAYYCKIKEIIDSGELGKIMTIQHNENIGNFHMAHSFVRGNWSRAELSSSLIMQKSCHDMDLLVWLAGSEAKSISSFGDLRYFKPSNAPENSTLRCADCPAASQCRFEAKKVYLPIAGLWPATVICTDQTESGITEALKTSPYGRCVYHCENNVCDSQAVLIQLKNGVTATFNLSGFTGKMSRTMKIMCEHGEIRCDDSLNMIEVIHFPSNQADGYETRIITPKIMISGHSGGDNSLVDEFLNAIQRSPDQLDSRSSVEKAIEGHLMAYAAEKSRLCGKTIDMDLLKEELSSDMNQHL